MSGRGRRRDGVGRSLRDIGGGRGRRPVGVTTALGRRGEVEVGRRESPRVLKVVEDLDPSAAPAALLLLGGSLVDLPLVDPRAPIDDRLLLLRRRRRQDEPPPDLDRVVPTPTVRVPKRDHLAVSPLDPTRHALQAPQHVPDPHPVVRTPKLTKGRPLGRPKLAAERVAGEGVEHARYLNEAVPRVEAVVDADTEDVVRRGLGTRGEVVGDGYPGCGGAGVGGGEGRVEVERQGGVAGEEDEGVGGAVEELDGGEGEEGEGDSG